MGIPSLMLIWEKRKYFCFNERSRHFDLRQGAQEEIGKYIHWYNSERSHSSLDDSTPDEVYFRNVTTEMADISN